MFKVIVPIVGIAACGWLVFRHFDHVNEVTAKAEVAAPPPKLTTPALAPSAKSYIFVTKNTTLRDFISLKLYNQPINLDIKDNMEISEHNIADTPNIINLRLTNLKQVTGRFFHKLTTMEFLYLENCPKFQLSNILSAPSLKRIYLRNMQHVEDRDVNLLQKQGVHVIDQRFDPSWDDMR